MEDNRFYVVAGIVKEGKTSNKEPYVVAQYEDEILKAKQTIFNSGAVVRFTWKKRPSCLVTLASTRSRSTRLMASLSTIAQSLCAEGKLKSKHWPCWVTRCLSSLRTWLKCQLARRSRNQGKKKFEIRGFAPFFSLC